MIPTGTLSRSTLEGRDLSRSHMAIGKIRENNDHVHKDVTR